MCENLGIRTPVRLEIVIRVNTIYGYHYRASTRLKYQKFENRLKTNLESGPQFAEVWLRFTKLHFVMGNVTFKN